MYNNQLQQSLWNCSRYSWKSAFVVLCIVGFLISQYGYQSMSCTDLECRISPKFEWRLMTYKKKFIYDLIISLLCNQLPWLKMKSAYYRYKCAELNTDFTNDLGYTFYFKIQRGQPTLFIQLSSRISQTFD